MISTAWIGSGYNLLLSLPVPIPIEETEAPREQCSSILLTFYNLNSNLLNLA